MSKAIRTRMMKEVTTRFKGPLAGVFIDFRGLDGKAADSLRKELRAAKIEVDVLKNSLAVRAFKDLGLSGLEKTLEGMTALVHGPDPADVAKKLFAWKEKNKKLEIKSGILENKVLSLAEVKQLSTMPNRMALLSQLAGLIAQPMTDIAGCLNALLQDTAGLLKALEEKKSKEGGAP
ncbi:MAG: large subunit ribosomal protein [Planctomycetota bacterium]|nr:MAG: large subunit ribosomal protein [Planctomycetota bacterium]